MFCRMGRGAALSLLIVATFLRPAQAAAANWLPFGPDGGDARSITADPADHTHLYLGTVNGWVYESHDTGASWRRLSRIATRDDLVIDNIVVDPVNPRHLILGAFALSKSDGGLFISQDAGRSWMPQTEMNGQSVRALTAAPSDPNLLIAGTLQGVFRSRDGGTHWNQISPPDSTEIHEVESVAVDPVDPKIIYAGTWHLPWKTTDGGEHWEPMKEGIIEDSDVFSIIVDPKSPQTVYASACSGIYKSDNGGSLFHKIQGIPSTARRTRVLLQDPNNLAVVFAGTTEGLWRSEDSGKTWNRLTNSDVIVNDVQIDKGDSKKVLIATDRGGIFASEDGGSTFHDSNSGFSARQITAIKRDDNHPSRVFVGVVNDKQWGGVFESRNGGIQWSQLSAGLGGRDVFTLGQAPDGTMIAGTGHGLYRLDQSAGAWVRVEASLAPAAVVSRRPVHPVTRSRTGNLPLHSSLRNTANAKHRSAAHSKVQPVHPRKAATARVPPSPPSPKLAATPDPASAPGLTKPVGSSAGDPSGTGFDGSVYALATASTRLLAATSAGLLSSVDNGRTWVLSGPERSDSWRFLAAAKSSVIAASLYNIASSADGGTTWKPVLLPEGLTQVSAIATQPSGELWVGGREGVFVSTDDGKSWSTPRNLFVNSVNSIFYDEATDRLLITTDGYSKVVFLVQLPARAVTFADTGWSLRFARPMGDYMIGATRFDGIVVQPQMVVSPMQSSAQPLAAPAPVHPVKSPPGSP